MKIAAYKILIELIHGQNFIFTKEDGDKILSSYFKLHLKIVNIGMFGIPLLSFHPIGQNLLPFFQAFQYFSSFL